MQGRSHFEDPGTDEELLATLGERLAGERLRRNLTQTTLAKEAGVSRATVQRLEAGESTQLTNLLRILRALDLVERLEQLVPKAPLRPLQELERRSRRRATSRAPRAESPKPSEWTWGEDA